MTEDNDQDLIPSNPSSEDAAPTAKKTAPKNTAKPEAKVSEPKKPSLGAKAMREIPLSKGDEFFPADDEEEEEDDEDDEDAPLFEDESDEADGDIAPEALLVATDTSERIILVVDEDGQRRNETVAIISQILPNAVIEVADTPEDALAMMAEGDFDTFVVNFLMPGYSSSPFVKAVANHPEHPLLIGFAADKMSDAVDPKKGLKIIPLKRLFDLDTSNTTDTPEGEPPED